VNRALRRPPASRLATVGAALSLVATSASVALAADPVVAPVVPGAPSAQPARATPPKALPTTPPNPPPSSPRNAPPAAPDETAVDDDLIEFLGSIGDTTEEGDWLDFLSNTDIDKVAKRGSKTPPRDR
jgi:hypothetical protein